MKYATVSASGLFVLAILGALCGCSQTIEFRFVDAESRRPVDVRVVVNRRDSDYWSTSEKSFDLGTSQNGRISISGIRDTATWRTRISFFNPLYYEAGVSAEAGTFRTYCRVPASVDPSGETISPTIFQKDGEVLVELWPARTNQGDLRLRDWPDQPRAARAGEDKLGKYTVVIAVKVGEK